jgi:quercetin dioxygenase-like cupin family protein
MIGAKGFWTAAAAAALLFVSADVSADEKQEYKVTGAEQTELVYQQGLAAGDQFEARMIRFDLPPGYQGGKHYHTGDIFVYVQSGSLTSETANGTKTYKAGEAFYETPGEVMQPRNQSAEENTVLIVFQVGKPGEPLMVKAE